MVKLKAFADDKMYVTEKIEICFGTGRKHCGKRKECSFSHNDLKKPSFSRLFKVGIVKELKDQLF